MELKHPSDLAACQGTLVTQKSRCSEVVRADTNCSRWGSDWGKKEDTMNEAWLEQEYFVDRI